MTERRGLMLSKFVPHLKLLFRVVQFKTELDLLEVSSGEEKGEKEKPNESRRMPHDMRSSVQEIVSGGSVDAYALRLTGFQEAW